MPTRKGVLDNRDMFVGRTEVRRNRVAVRHPEPHRKRARFGRITLENGQLGAGREDAWRDTVLRGAGRTGKGRRGLRKVPDACGR